MKTFELPSILNISKCEDLPASYQYIGVFSGTADDPMQNRLRLLYDLSEHLGDEITNRDGDSEWTDHWSAFASRINENWDLKTGYWIVAFADLSNLKQSYTTEEMKAFPSDSDHQFEKSS